MKADDLLDLIGEVDDPMIAEAKHHRKSRKNPWVRWGAVAACLCLVVAGAVFWKTAAKPVHEGSHVVLSENGVTIPKMEVTVSANSAADMLGFFIYRGSCYVQYEWIEDADIVGEYLGTATGLIDEWTPKDGYVELAGSVKGDFFSVKGYDPAFLLCMKHDTGVVSTYICNNGITLKYGAELYEDRLHLSDHAAVQYETRESWNNSKNERYQMNGNEETISSFIEQLDRAEFLSWDDVIAREGLTIASIYDTERYHMYFIMPNGTTVHLRLYENGYARFDGLLDVCVQVPEESFRVLMDAMKDHTAAEPVDVFDPTAQKLETCRNDPELGAYVPTYEVPGTALLAAEVYYEIEPRTGVETGTREIYVEYTSVTDPNLYYALIVARRDEYEGNSWAGPMIDCSELSAEALTEYESIRESTGVTKLNVGVWFGDVSVVLTASGMDAEAAFEIFRSVQ